MYDYRGWIETAPPGSADWQRYEDDLPQEPDETEPPGVFLADEGMFDSLDELARWLLKTRLKEVVRHYADQPDLQVRACAQRCDQPQAGPVIIREPTPQALAAARHAAKQAALTQQLRSACLGVYEAHSSLKAAIVRTHNAGLGREAINRAVSPLVDAEQVAHTIDAPELLREVRQLIRAHPEFAGRTVIRGGRMPEVTVELRWSDKEHDAEALRESAWNETIEEYDQELAAMLLKDARRAAGELLALLSTQFEVTPTTPEAVAYQALSYQPISVRRPSATR